MKHLLQTIVLWGLAVLLFVAMTWLDGHEGLTKYFGRAATATVVKYEQGEPGPIREGDWYMSYEYSAEDGTVFSGTMEFAPKRRPPDDIKEIGIRYLPRFPAVSGVHGYISTTGLTGYLFVGSLLIAGLVALGGLRPASRDEETNGNSAENVEQENRP